LATLYIITAIIHVQHKKYTCAHSTVKVGDVMKNITEWKRVR